MRVTLIKCFAHDILNPYQGGSIAQWKEYVLWRGSLTYIWNLVLTSCGVVRESNPPNLSVFIYKIGPIKYFTAEDS